MKVVHGHKRRVAVIRSGGEHSVRIKLPPLCFHVALALVMQEILGQGTIFLGNATGGNADKLCELVLLLITR
jgi:hypothetical protein